ncbi:tyrosine-type recombinase/integrase [Aurantimonas coralicida]|uniref:tyrosine-type recombinase/integrase n=1 Tax=Aurantimonas coralicida TaxID=182270 RepID=UPI001E4EEF78|nr:site-specific integrase [Aurantimonas coralicida]MCD1644520.1 integrase arm-type DNA-binding domain-containing protein [Aurantimonas coralicida]
MAKTSNKLSARAVATISKPGRHSDGDGLYLVVGPGSSRRWLFMFRWQGKLKEMGLGGVSSVTLAKARERAAEARLVLSEGRNPIEERRKGRAKRETAATFGTFADELVKDISHGFRNTKHIAQWSMTLTNYAAPLRDMPLQDITTDDILNVLKPIWQTKNETASRLRGRIEQVLDAAKAKGLRSGENPARWRGHLEMLLPKRQKLQRGHHAAMPYQDIPKFIASLHCREAAAALALEFTILTAARSGEALGALWSEIDQGAKMWTIPADRMKAGRQHRVPLSPRALEILKKMEQAKVSGYIFPGQKAERPLSNMAMSMMLRRMNLAHFTVHGFRSAFRDWAGETTDFPREIAELSLAHSVGDATERAYSRGDALEKRRALMDAWASYCQPPMCNEICKE